MIKDSINIEQVIALLNDLNNIDPLATRNLFESRVYCSSELEKHPTIITMEGPTIGPLGLINGFFDTLSNGRGQITAVYEDDETKIIRFEKTKQP
jgi:hypothetical protein